LRSRPVRPRRRRLPAAAPSGHGAAAPRAGPRRPSDAGAV